MKNRRYVISAKSAAVLLTICIAASSIFGFAGGFAAAGYYDAGSDKAAPWYSINTKAELASVTDATATDSESGFAPASELSTAEVARLTADTVVEITTETVTTDSWMQQYVTKGAGSGVILSQDGYIITNNHVIDGARKITVRLKNGTEYPASLVGTDSKTDVAVLKIKASGLKPAVLGDSDILKVGDKAVAIGNPLGKLGGTVTEGIISALDRELVIDGKTMLLMQTDAAINPGNSGGGLFNSFGELIGIVVAKSSGSDVEGLGFAIPVNATRKVAAELVQYGYVKGRIDTGMTFVEVTSLQKALLYGVGQLGVYVKSVEPGSNAARAGFKAGDLITHVGNTKITSGTVLTQALEKYDVGDTVTIRIIRNGYPGQLSLKLAEYMPR